MATAAKAALELHIHHEPLLGENKIQQSTSPCYFICQLEKEMLISTFQEPPGSLKSCFVAHPTDIRVAEVPHEHEREAPVCVQSASSAWSSWWIDL
ncbi:dual specificity protein phosphatase cdc14b-like [Willisornis vidua]|uniref:Dual specificity protein phosphatase cdc14b-like n=1 Tax=Willisornis vidua TaxID=1566151 RepID=A0ABQ9DSE0_9PASS|nr:dual specificity protein phosphatase cdc14b-like [Willisornis vidua]